MTYCKQHTALITLAVDGVFCTGMRVVSEETQDSVKASVTISPGSHQLQFKPINGSKSRIQGNAQQLFHCQLLCIKQENEDKKGWSSTNICNVARPRIKNVSCTWERQTRCTVLLINLFQLNYPLHSLIKIDQLVVTCFIISLFTAQNVSNVSTSIFRSL